MLDLILYCIAVVTGIILYWLHNPYKELKAKQRLSMYTRKPDTVADLLMSMEDEDIHFVNFVKFSDSYSSVQEVVSACLKVNLNCLRVIVGIDFSASNEWQGKKSYNTNNLHHFVPGKVSNPYQKVLSFLASSLDPYLPANSDMGSTSALGNSVSAVPGFTLDPAIELYAFGDSSSTNQSLTLIKQDGVPCSSFQEVLEVYTETLRQSKLELSGPTTFKQIIRRAIDVVNQDWTFRHLILLTDGQFSSSKTVSGTVKTIRDASMYPLGMTIVGVGDGPWELMEDFDDHVWSRHFDNTNFVSLNRVIARGGKRMDQRVAAAIMSILPQQFDFLHRRNLELQADMEQENLRRRWATSPMAEVT